MDLSIIIVNYKNKDKLSDCLVSLNNVNLSPLSYEIIIVDNNSGDDLNEFSSQRIKIINSPINLGMGKGNNLGISKSKGEVILIINPDTIIKGKAIPILFDYLQSHDDVGIVGPKLLNRDSSIQYSCARFPKVYTPILRRTFLGKYFKKNRDYFMMTNFDHNLIKEVDWLMGSCLMFRKKYFKNGKNIELRFDERYFMYFEDIDLCRQSWYNNLKVVYNPEGIVIHDHARESAKYPWYLALLTDNLFWYHINSWIKYFLKWKI